MSSYAVWTPQEGPQADAIQATWCPMLFFGGARGGGKSDYLLGDFLQDVGIYREHWQGILFRRTYDELQYIIARSYMLFPQTGAKYFKQAREWRWPNGACLRFRYLERDEDAERYQGHQYTWIGWDELTNWKSLGAFYKIKACLRWTEADVPTKRIRATGNPGGAAHNEVKKLFIEPSRIGYKLIDDELGQRMFIPSSVTDNKILIDSDRDYIKRLREIGSPELVRMWLNGDWDVILGSYFPEFNIQNHVIPPRKLPTHWQKICGMDWGHASPFSVLWAAYSSGKEDSGAESYIPKGSLIIYREYYGGSGKPNEGLRLSYDEFVNNTKKLEGEPIDLRIADPAIGIHEGGPSIQEELYNRGLAFNKADNNRIAGWLQLRQRLKTNAIFIFSTCTNLINHIPIQQHSKTNPEDLDTDLEDHDCDALRYICMSRPIAKILPDTQNSATFKGMNIQSMINEHRRKISRR